MKDTYKTILAVAVYKLDILTLPLNKALILELWNGANPTSRVIKCYCCTTTEKEGGKFFKINGDIFKTKYNQINITIKLSRRGKSMESGCKWDTEAQDL